MSGSRKFFFDSLMRNLSKFLSLNAQEKLSTFCTLALFVAVPMWVWWYQDKHIPDAFAKEAKVFNITGIGSEGKWTLEEVCGYNYWWKSFSTASIEVDEGDLVVLRLKSADATHIFYAPTLGVGPVSIEPGHVEVVTFRPTQKGIYEYYCMAVCGECHFFMRGMIAVGMKNNTADFSSEVHHQCEHELHEPTHSSLYDKGKYLFQKVGCVACHGEDAKGGVTNPNYIKGTVPALNTLAQTMALDEKKETEIFMHLIESGKSIDQMADLDIGIARQSLVLAKYQIVRDVIAKGKPAARADTTSFEPPLSMPMWNQKLSERDIDALIVYLLQQQPWEEIKE